MPNRPTGDRAQRRISPSMVKARALQTRRSLERQRRTNPVVDMGFRAVELHNRSGGGLLAGAIAFRFFMFIVPFAFVLVMGLGFGADATSADVRDVARQAGITGVVAAAVQAGAETSSVTRWVTFGLALVALVLGARNLVKSLNVAHALIWKVRLRRLPHPMLDGVAFIVIFALALALIRVVGALRGFSFVAWVLALGLYTIIPTAVWLLCSLRVFPARPGVTWREVWPGALTFGVGTQVLHVVTLVWVTRSFESKTETYGAIGAALTILIWAYLLGWLVTSSAAINAARWRGTRPSGHSAPAQASPREPDDVPASLGIGPPD